MSLLNQVKGNAPSPVNKADAEQAIDHHKKLATGLRASYADDIAKKQAERTLNKTAESSNSALRHTAQLGDSRSSSVILLQLQELLSKITIEELSKLSLPGFPRSFSALRFPGIFALRRRGEVSKELRARALKSEKQPPPSNTEKTAQNGPAPK